MRPTPSLRAHRPKGLTLIELMLVVALVAILATLAAPSFRDFILMQRLKAVNAQVVTDLEYARSEAAARGDWLRLSFRNDAAQTCYALFTAPRTSAETCDCRLGAGAACSGDLREVRVVQVPSADGVRVVALTTPGSWDVFAFDHITGGLAQALPGSPQVPIVAIVIETSIDSSRVLRTEVGPAGRVKVCAPASLIVGAAAC